MTTENLSRKATLNTAATVTTTWNRDKTNKTLKELFGFSRQDGNGDELAVEVYENTPPDEWFAVKSDSKYIYPETETLMVLLALSRNKRNRIWIAGYAGTGKTQLAINVLTAMKYPFIRMSFDSSTSRSEVVGRWTAKNGTTEFVYSPLIKAMKFGAAVILDEIDSANPDVMAVLRSILEENPHIMVPETGELIKAHKDFRVIATANTFGAGDETGLFRTTNVMSVPDRQRFPIKVKMDYLPNDAEVKMITEEFSDISKKEAKKFVQVADSIRNKFKQGELDEALSPRELLAWVDTYLAVGDVQTAAYFTFLNGYPSEATTAAVLEIIRVAFPQEEDPNAVAGTTTATP